MKISTRKFIILTGVILCLAGTAGVVPVVYFEYRNRVAFDKAVSAQPLETPINAPLKPETVSGKPTALIIPSLGINLAVSDGTYNPRSGAWALSNNKAHFALMSAQPNNEKGNTFIYGHYRPEVFARLHKIKPGGEVILKTNNGHQFVYSFKTDHITTPADTSVFSYQGKPQLTLQTCTGAFMQDRRLFDFDFVRYEKIQ